MNESTPADFRADLHCHSLFSDGSMSPECLVDLAVSIGLKGFSISDHDTIDAYPDVLLNAKKSGIEMISGVEFSSIHQGTSVHILAYSFDIRSKDIQDFCAEHQKRRENRTIEILELLKRNQMPLTEEELYCNRINKKGIGRPHIAQAMVKKGYVKNIIEAFKKYLGEGKPCYASGKPYSVEETMHCIRQANGYCVIAHPHLIDKKNVLKNLLLLPFDGIECYYARFPLEQNLRWVDIAVKKNWMILGGSDFHGDMKPQLALGSSWTKQDTFDVLFKRFKENQHDQGKQKTKGK